MAMKEPDNYTVLKEKDLLHEDSQGISPADIDAINNLSDEEMQQLVDVLEKIRGFPIDREWWRRFYFI